MIDWHSGISAALAEVGSRHGVERDWASLTNADRRRPLWLVTNQKSPGFNIDDVHRGVLDERVAWHGLEVISETERTAMAKRRT